MSLIGIVRYIPSRSPLWAGPRISITVVDGQDGHINDDLAVASSANIIGYCRITMVVEMIIQAVTSTIFNQ